MSIQQLNINTSHKAQGAAPCYGVIQVAKTYVIAGIIDEYDNTVCYIKYFSAKNGLADAELLHEVAQVTAKFKPKKYLLATEDTRFTILPNTLQDLEAAKSTFQYLFASEPNDIIEIQTIPWQNYHGVYAVKQNTHAIFNEIFAGPKVVNAHICLLAAYNNFVKEGNAIFVCCNAEDVIVTIYENKQLLLHQAYEIVGEKDIAYYVYKAAEVLKINEASIYISGVAADRAKASLSTYAFAVTYIPLINGFMYPPLNETEIASLFQFFSIAKYAHH